MSGACSLIVSDAAAERVPARTTHTCVLQMTSFCTRWLKWRARAAFHPDAASGSLVLPQTGHPNFLAHATTSLLLCALESTSQNSARPKDENIVVDLHKGSSKQYRCQTEATGCANAEDIVYCGSKFSSRPMPGRGCE